MKILAIKNTHLAQFEKNKLYPLVPVTLESLEQKSEYLEREPLETNPEYRQLIPYIVVISPAGYCLMQRCKGQGEARLLGKLYIGAGGHVEEGHSVFYTALKECTEELGLPLRTLELNHLLISTGAAVDDVHVCICGTAQTDYTEFKSPEGTLHNARWVTREHLIEQIGEMENWSQLIVKQLL